MFTYPLWSMSNLKKITTEAGYLSLASGTELLLAPLSSVCRRTARELKAHKKLLLSLDLEFLLLLLHLY